MRGRKKRLQKGQDHLGLRSHIYHTIDSMVIQILYTKSPFVFAVSFPTHTGKT